MQQLVSQDQELGIIYRVNCQNPGCHYIFTLQITPKDVGLLSRGVVCPHCRRPGGVLKRNRRLGDKVFSAALTFKSIGSSEVAGDE